MQEYNGGCFSFVLILILGGFFSYYSLLSIDKYVEYVEYVEVEKIYSIKDSNDISGNFALGRGSFETKTVYRFYVKDGEYFKPESLSSENIRILRDSNQEPHIKYIHQVRVKKGEKAAEYYPNIKRSSADKIIIVVPEDAVELNFELDSH